MNLPLELQHKLARRLLKIAADEFSNHGCNDFDLVKEGGLTLEEAKQVQAAVTEDDEPRDDEFTMDCMVMAYLADNLGAAEEIPEG